MKTGAIRGGKSFDFSRTVESEASAGGVTVGASIRFRYGYAVDFKRTESTFYQGTVGGLPGEPWTTDRYSYGVFVYRQSLEGQGSFPVVNYWVE